MRALKGQGDKLRIIGWLVPSTDIKKYVDHFLQRERLDLFPWPFQSFKQVKDPQGILTLVGFGPFFFLLGSQLRTHQLFKWFLSYFHVLVHK